MIYLLDTNVVSDFLKKHPLITAAIVDALERGNRLLISHPVHYELNRTLIRHNATAQLNRLNNHILP